MRQSRSTCSGVCLPGGLSEALALLNITLTKVISYVLWASYVTAKQVPATVKAVVLPYGSKLNHPAQTPPDQFYGCMVNILLGRYYPSTVLRPVPVRHGVLLRTNPHSVVFRAAPVRLALFRSVLRHGVVIRLTKRSERPT